MTDQELKDLVASLAIESKKTDEQMKKTGNEMKQFQKQIQLSQAKTDKQLNKLGKLLGNISNSQGAVAEEFFINSIKKTQNIGGIQYDFMYENLKKVQNKIEDEFDIVLVNGRDIAIIEIKYKLNDTDIDKLLNKKIVNFKKLYPEYKNYNQHIGLASFKVYDKIKQRALDNNIFILQRKGDLIESFLP